MSSHLSFSQIIADIPTFDGQDSCKTWLLAFQKRCEFYDLDDERKLRNMDSFLVGIAGCWWSYVGAPILAGLGATNAKEKFQSFTSLIEEAFVGKDDKEAAEIQNDNLLFRPSFDNPKEFIMRKHAIFERIDADMSEQKKVAHLVNSLPQDLKLPIRMHLGANSTVAQFELMLDHFSEMYMDQSSGSVAESMSSVSSNSNDESVEVANDHPDRDDSLTTSPASASHGRLCGYCQDGYHSIRVCPMFRQNFDSRSQHHHSVELKVVHHERSCSRRDFYDTMRHHNKSDTIRRERQQSPFRSWSRSYAGRPTFIYCSFCPAYLPARLFPYFCHKCGRAMGKGRSFKIKERTEKSSRRQPLSEDLDIKKQLK